MALAGRGGGRHRRARVFFCSGFGLTLSQRKRPLGFPAFLRRRFLKIYLPYILAVFLSAGYEYLRQGSVSWQALLSHVFLYKMFVERFQVSFGVQFWFISTILQFYLLFLPLYALRRRLPARTMVLGALGLSALWWVLTRLLGVEDTRVWGCCFLQYLWEFVLGMAAADWLAGKERVVLPRWLLPAAALAGLGLQTAMSLAGGWLKAFNDLPGFFGFAALALLLFFSCRRVLRPVFLGLNAVSYEWFLVHVLAFQTAYRWLRPRCGSAALLMAVLLLWSLALALVYAFLLRRLLWRSRRQESAPAEG